MVLQLEQVLELVVELALLLLGWQLVVYNLDMVLVVPPLELEEQLAEL